MLCTPICMRMLSFKVESSLLCADVQSFAKEDLEPVQRCSIKPLYSLEHLSSLECLCVHTILIFQRQVVSDNPPPCCPY